MPAQRKIASIVFTGATAAAAAVAANPVPGQAVTITWHIRATSKRVPYKGLVNGALKTGTTGMFKDVTTGASTRCTSAPLRASVPASTRTGSSVLIGTVSYNISRKTEFINCRIGGTIPVSISVVPEPSLRASRYTKVTSTADVKIAHLHAKMNGKGNNCKAGLSGTVYGTFSDTNHKLVFGASRRAALKVSTVKSCGLLHAGDMMYYAATDTISKPNSLRISASSR